jgi:hypothetical protein
MAKPERMSSFGSIIVVNFGRPCPPMYSFMAASIPAFDGFS